MVFLFHVYTDGLGEGKIKRKIAEICLVTDIDRRGVEGLRIPDTRETGWISLIKFW